MAYSEPCLTSKMERFAKIGNPLPIFAKPTILDVWQGSKYATGMRFIVWSQTFMEIAVGVFQKK